MADTRHSIIAVAFSVFIFLSGCAVQAEPPIANAGENLTATLNTTATLTGSCTDPQAQLQSCGWSLPAGCEQVGNLITTGDQTGQTVTANVKCQNQGSYIFTLTALNTAGKAGADNITLTVAAAEALNVKPTATLLLNEVTMLTAKINYGCSDSDGAVTSCVLEYGDGTKDRVTVMQGSIQHTYATAGSYFAKLTAIDSKGAVTEKSLQVTVTEDVVTPDPGPGPTPDGAIVLDTGVAEIIQITTSKAKQHQVNIFENMLVWTDERGGNKDIYLYNIDTGKETQITDDPADQYQPSIYGDNIVWTDERNGHQDIYRYDLRIKKEFRLTVSPRDQYDPQAYVDAVVWSDNKFGNDYSPDVVLYEIPTGTEIKLTTGIERHDSADVSDDIIVYRNYINYYPDITYYNIQSKQTIRVTADQTLQHEPAVSGKRLVWTEVDRRGTKNIVMHDIETKKTSSITDNEKSKSKPDIFGKTIVWEQGNGKKSIFLHNTGTKETVDLSRHLSNQFAPKIYGNIVAWTDERTGNKDIFIAKLKGRFAISSE